MLFSMIDLHSGYHQICIRPKDEWNMAFETTNWLSNLFIMQQMNQVLCLFIGMFVAVYFNDFLIYSKQEKEHLDHLR